MSANSRVILITGASRGIGYASARLLAAHGYTVYGTSRTPEKTQVEGFELLKLDVRDDQSVTVCVQTVLDRAGHIDVLVNNAGYSLSGAAEEATAEDARSLFETNFFGILRMNNAVLPHMRKARRGHIINISSIAGIVGVPYLGIYTATKFALEGYSETLRHELRDLGIAVSLVEPGDIHTDIVTEAPSNRFADYDGAREQTLAIHERNVRSGPPPEKVAQALLKVIESPSPRLRYAVTYRQEFWVPWMKRLLPDWLTEALVRDNYKIGKNRSG